MESVSKVIEYLEGFESHIDFDYELLVIDGKINHLRIEIITEDKREKKYIMDEINYKYAIDNIFKKYLGE